MKNSISFFKITVLICISTCGVSGCSDIQSESNRLPLKIYLNGSDFGFGAIIYTESEGQSSNELFLDSNNIGITSYRFSRLIEISGNEPKYQFFRIIDEDTIPQILGGKHNDSTSISSASSCSFSSSNMKNRYHYIEFYAGKYPERRVGIHIDSTEIGKWNNGLATFLEEMDDKNIMPQKR